MFDEAKDFLKTRAKTNLIIVLINTVVFVFLSFKGNTESAQFVLENGGCYTPYVLKGEYYRLITSVFIHFGIQHFIYNMLCLMTVGDRLERAWGPVRYLIVFLAGGLAGNAATVLTEQRTGQFAVSAGASGAIFAVLGALVIYIFSNRDRFGSELTNRVMIVTVLMLAQGFMTKGTNNIAHVGGAAAGLILGGLFALTAPRRPRKRRR